MVPFETLGEVSYSPSIVTMAVCLAMSEIFSVKQWRELGNQVIENDKVKVTENGAVRQMRLSIRRPL